MNRQRQDDHDIILAVRDLVVEHDGGDGRTVHAVSGISFDIRRGETLGLVGESGCGKTSAARAVMQLPRPTRGSVHLEGMNLAALPRKDLRPLRAKFQMIFQDPIASLNPRRRVRDIVGGPLAVQGELGTEEKNRRVAEVLSDVGLNAEQTMERLPHEFSGGQCQRISLARAIILEPKLLICDEPVSALDVSVQAQILNLLEEMKARHALTMLFISHDLAVVKHISDRVAVMYLGKLCELAPAEELYRHPGHPYTAALLAAVPAPDPERPLGRIDMVAGELPSPTDPPSGCRFRTRCPHAQPLCAEQEPKAGEVSPGHTIACHFPLSG